MQYELVDSEMNSVTLIFLCFSIFLPAEYIRERLGSSSGYELAVL